MGQQALAQNYKQDVLSVYNTLLGSKTYSMQLRYSIFLDNDTKKPFQQRDVKIVRQDANLYLKQSAQMEVIDTKNCQVLIDHQDKQFSIIQKENEEASTMKVKQDAYQLISNNIDTVLAVYEKIKLVTNTNEVVKYECTPKANDEIAMVWIEIDKKLKFYRSITTKYKQKTKVKELNNSLHLLTLTINYVGLSFNPQIAPTLFNELNYVTFKGNKAVGPSKRYSHYKYLNDNTP